MSQLRHPNIIKIYQIEKFNNFYMMTMKLCSKSVSDYQEYRIKEERRPFSDEECAAIARGILSGLAYMHDEMNIIHRDMKTQNVMIPDEEDADLSRCHIIDFGLAIFDSFENREKNGNAGTPVFMPPEQVRGQNYYGKGADIWATGLIIYKLLTNEHPFINRYMSRDEISQEILKFEHLDFPPDSKVSPHAQHLLQRMISRETSQRYSASEACQHPWITRDFT